jgi:hypothetical protein
MRIDARRRILTSRLRLVRRRRALAIVGRRLPAAIAIVLRAVATPFRPALRLIAAARLRLSLRRLAAA